jgi:ribosomal protein S27E
MPKMGDAYRENDSAFRSHLGGSMIGAVCDRALWYGFHWTTQPSFGGRILRLFNRGHLEEARFIAMMESAGITVWCEEQGKQFRISEHNGHFGGSLDAILHGVPDMPDVHMLGEFKTHNNKSFCKLVADGLQSSKWQHYIQMQVYMFKMGLEYGLYLAVNKNDDTLYGEIITRKDSLAKEALNRAHSIIYATAIPKRISDRPSRFECKYCDHKNVCFGKEMPLSNCRTCISASPKPKGQWFCEKFNQKLSKAKQEEGCDDHDYKVGL